MLLWLAVFDHCVPVQLRIRFNHSSHSPKVLTLAAAEQTDQEGDDENTSNHCQGDYQCLEVHYRQRRKHRVMQVVHSHRFYLHNNNNMSLMLSFFSSYFESTSLLGCSKSWCVCLISVLEFCTATDLEVIWFNSFSWVFKGAVCFDEGIHRENKYI